jgi:hypothetical protein
VEPVEFERDRRRLRNVGALSLVLAGVALVLLITAFRTDAGFEVVGVEIPEVLWIVVWGAMAGFAAMAAARGILGARDPRPGLVVDDGGIAYRLELLGDGSRLGWAEVAGVERARLNRHTEVVRIHTKEGRRLDLRTDLLASVTADDVLAAIEARRPW